MRKALFIDLDNTLIQTITGETFPRDINDWEFIEDTIDALVGVINEGRIDYVIIVTNQGGIEKGFVREEDFVEKMDNILTELEDILDIPILYKYCISMKGYERKPNPGMAYEAALELELDLLNSIMVGDASGFESSFSDSDFKFAENSGIGTYYDVAEFYDEYGKPT